jgi:hypothetical protein
MGNIEDKNIMIHGSKRDKADAPEESHRQALRLLAAMIARCILLDRSKRSEKQGNGL